MSIFKDLRNLKDSFVLAEIMRVTLQEARALNELCVYPKGSGPYARGRLFVAICNLKVEILECLLSKGLR